MGVESVPLRNLGYAPKLPSRLNLRFEDVELRESNGHGKTCADDALMIEDVLSEWWGCRALMQKFVDTVQLPAAKDNGGHSDVLSLPDDVMTMILAQLPRQSLAMARRVCSSWKRVAEQQELASLRCKMGVAEGWIYVLPESPEGSPFRAYDPIAAQWSVLPPTPGSSENQHWQGFACAAVGHKFLLMGGTRTQKSPTPDKHSSAVVCSDVVIYDALTNKWTKGARMNTARSWFAAAVVGDKVFVAGGQGNTKFLDSAEVYDLQTDSWKMLSSMAVVRSSCHGVALDGQFWVIAGEYQKSYQKSSAEVYDAVTDSWRFVPNMYLDNNKVMEPSAVTANGELICIHQKRVMAYNTQMNDWTQLGHINGGEEYARPYSRYGFACESVGSNLYILGGIREYSQNRYRSCTPLSTVEACELGGESKQSLSQLGWKLGADMCEGGGVISASLVTWL